MKLGDLVKWRDPVPNHPTCPSLFGLVVRHLKPGWVSIHWFADDVPGNPTREPVMHLEIISEHR